MPVDATEFRYTSTRAADEVSSAWSSTAVILIPLTNYLVQKNQTRTIAPANHLMATIIAYLSQCLIVVPKLF